MKEILSDFQRKVIDCIQKSLDEIALEHEGYFSENEIDFKKTVNLAWDNDKVWFYEDSSNPMSALPASLRSQIDTLIADCFAKCSQSS